MVYLEMTSNGDMEDGKEKKLLNALKKGDKNAFNILYERHWELAYNSAYKRLRDPELVKDILQEIFASIWLNRETNIENMEAYLHVAVRNQVSKQLRRMKVTYPLTESMDDQLTSHLVADEHIRLSEFNVAFEQLLTGLPPQRQLIFRLRFQEDLSTKLIAEQMGITQKTVQNQLGKTMEKIRGSLVSLSTQLVLLVICLS